MCLEPFVAGEATANFDAAALHELRDMQISVDQSLERQATESSLSRTKRFHFGIYERSNLPETIDIVRGLWARLGPHLTLVFLKMRPQIGGAKNHHEVLARVRIDVLVHCSKYLLRCAAPLT